MYGEGGKNQMLAICIGLIHTCKRGRTMMPAQSSRTPVYRFKEPLSSRNGAPPAPSLFVRNRS